MKAKILILLAFMFVFLVGCSEEAPFEERSSETTVSKETGVPLPTPVSTGVTILADGSVQTAQFAVPLAFEISGMLLDIHVKVGDLIQEGDVVATLSSTAIAQAELNVVRAQQTLDDIYENADVEAAQALLAVEAAQKAMDDLLRSNVPAATAWQAVVEAEDAVADAQSTVYISQATAGQAAINSAYANMLLAEKEFERLEQVFEDFFADLPEGNLRRANAQANLSAAQQNYDRAVANYNALTSTQDAETQALASARLETAKAQLADAQREWERVKDGPSAGDIAQVEADLAAAQARWDVLKEGPDPERIALAESELALAQTEAGLANDQLAAPWSGTVLSVDATPGVSVGAGTPIITILDLAQLEFHTTNLSERDLGQIFSGQMALITLKTYPDAPIEAAVLRIGLQAGEVVGDAATFPVVLLLGDTELEIRPGMTGRVEILTDE